MSLINRGITPDLFFANALPVLEELIFSDMKNWPDMIQTLANYKSATGWGTQTTEQSGVGPATLIPEGGSVTYDDIAQGNEKTFTFLKYGQGVKITEEMIEDDKWGQIQDIYRSLGPSVFHTRQQIFFDNFNNGFTTNGYDGVPLFSTAHPLIKAGGTQRNRPSSDVDLSVASYRAALTDIAGWLTHEGLRSYWMPRKLLLSTTNIYDGIEILKSDYKPGTANNDINAHNAMFTVEPVYSPYLTDVDAWFVMCDGHKLMFYDRKPPTTKSFEDFDNGALKTKIQTRFDTGHASWYGWWGTTGI